MNSSINIASPNTPGANETSISGGKKTAQDSVNSDDTEDLAASAESFHESIKKAYDESKNKAEPENTDRNEKAADGNHLPVADDFPEIAAQDDRPVLPGGLYLSGQLATGDTSADGDNLEKLPSLSTETAIEGDTEVDAELAALSASAAVQTSLDADKKLAGDDKLIEMSSQLRQLLNAETSSATKKSQATLNSVTSGSADTADTTVDNTVIQQSDSLTLKTELAGLNGDKASFLLNTSAQPVSSNIQTSLLLQTANALSDTGGDALPVLTGTSTATINPQTALPQAGITEAFGRPAWSQGMGKQILLMINQNISTAEIRLNPAHLGPIEVLIDMSEEQVSVSMNSRHAMVRDAMEQALPKLREMLEQNGFSLADADISKHSFAEQREQNSERNSKGFSGSHVEQAAVSEASRSVIRQTAMSNSMVDYYI